MKQNVGKREPIPTAPRPFRMASCTQKGSVKVKGDAAALWKRILEFTFYRAWDFKLGQAHPEISRILLGLKTLWIWSKPLIFQLRKRSPKTVSDFSGSLS